MYQVTAIYQGAEIGYGEGNCYEYAATECSESVPDIYPVEDVQMICAHGILIVSTPLEIWRMFNN